jgi:hypothetical protein
MKGRDRTKDADSRGRRRFLLWNVCAGLGALFSPLLRRGPGRGEERSSGGREARYYRKLKEGPR